VSAPTFGNIPLLPTDQLKREFKRRFGWKGRRSKGDVTLGMISEFVGFSYNHSVISAMMRGVEPVTEWWQVRLSQVLHWLDTGELVVDNGKLVRLPPKPPTDAPKTLRPWIDFSTTTLRLD
jgi:hypothetical protein